MDYWEQFREGLQDFHRAGGSKKSDLDRIVAAVQDPKKFGRYSTAIEGYKKFLGRKGIEWFDPASDEWKLDELSVKVNPVLGLEIDVIPYLIKLYFKDESPTKNRVEVVLERMKTVLGPGVLQDTRMAVLESGSGCHGSNEGMPRIIFESAAKNNFNAVTALHLQSRR